MVSLQTATAFSNRIFERYDIDGQFIKTEDSSTSRRILYYAILLYGETFPVGTNESSLEDLVKTMLRTVRKVKKQRG